MIEQWRPLGERKSVSGALAAWAASLERSFNGGERRHGMVAWLVAVLPPVVAAAVLLLRCWRRRAACSRSLFNIAVLYLTLGFRQFSHYFTDIQLAVKAGDIERARALLDAVARRLGRGALARGSDPPVDRGSAGRRAPPRVRRAALVPAAARPERRDPLPPRRLPRRALEADGRVRQLRAAAFHVLEWPAVRLTAAAFALVGDFENAVYCWRTQARTWADPDAGIVLAAGAGAMGVRLGMPVQEVDGMQPRPELGVGRGGRRPVPRHHRGHAVARAGAVGRVLASAAVVGALARAVA